MYGSMMLSLILKCISFISFTCIKIAIALTRSIQYMVLDVCNIVEDSFQLNIRPDGRRLTFENSDVISTLSNNMTSSNVSCQTEEGVVVSNEFDRISKAGLLIYDFDETKIITISHNEASSKWKPTFCDNCEIQINPTRHKSKTSTSTNTKASPKYKFELNHNHRKFNSSEYSNMSLEKDASSAEISTYSQNSTLIKSHNSSYESSDHSSNEITEGNEYSTTFVLTDNEMNSSNINETGEFSRDVNDLCSQWTYPVTKSRVSWCESDIKCSSEKSPDFSCEGYANKDLSHIFDEQNDSNSTDKTVINNSMKQRLSLSSNFNSTDRSILNFRKIQNEIIEDALKRTPRHEKTKDITYPYSNEIHFIITDEDSKEMLSCSSYESLPVSDHMRNSFENSAFYSLCKENFLDASTPDFSCVDDFIEAFEQMKTTLSASELVKSAVSNIAQNEVKIFRTQSCDFLQRTRFDERNESLNKTNTNCISLDNILESFGDRTAFNGFFNLKQTKEHECQDLKFNKLNSSSNILIPENVFPARNPKVYNKCNDKSKVVVDNFLNLDESPGKFCQSNVGKSVLSETNFNTRDIDNLGATINEEKDILCLDEKLIDSDAKCNTTSENEITFANEVDEKCDVTPSGLNILEKITDTQDNIQCKDMMGDSSTEINTKISGIESVSSEEHVVEELFTFIDENISEESSSDTSALTVKEL